MKLILICLIIAGAFVVADPLTPIWPAIFAQDFVEYFSVNNATFANVGTYQYYAPSNSTRLSRSNGKYDPFCIGYKNFNETNAPCEHLIVQNTRYMYYPDTQDCCYCCSAEEGCGILKQDWLQGGTFLGVDSVYGKEAFSWVMYEGPNKPNYLWETTEQNPLDRQILKIARNNYVEVYIQDQARYADIQNIELPSVCNPFNKCPTGKCAVFRGDVVVA